MPSPVYDMTAPGPSSYAELFASLPDVLEGTYQQFLSPFDPASVEVPAALRNSFLAMSSEVPKVFLCSVDDLPIIRVIHHPSKFVPILGCMSDWDNAIFACASDIGEGNQVTLIRWPDNAFNWTMQMCVPMTATMDTQFTAATGANCVGPYEVADANTEEVQTRAMFPVSSPYTEFVMQRQMFTPHQMWMDLVSLIIANGHVVDCSLFINWAHAACITAQLSKEM